MVLVLQQILSEFVNFTPPSLAPYHPNYPPLLDIWKKYRLDFLTYLDWLCIPSPPDNPSLIFSNHKSGHRSYCHDTCLAIISKWLSAAQNPWNVHKVFTNPSSLCFLQTSLPSQWPLFSPCSVTGHCSAPQDLCTCGAHNPGCVPWLSTSAQVLFLLRHSLPLHSHSLPLARLFLCYRSSWYFLYSTFQRACFILTRSFD